MALRIRTMAETDVDLGMQLKNQAGWNQTEADWHRFLALEPAGCFVAEWKGQAVGTTTTSVFGDVGWIAMVLVHNDFRHRGIATRLVQHALDYLESQGVATARLDATALGRPVYERMGFLAERELARFEGTAAARETDVRVAAFRPEDRAAIVRLDERMTATPRRRLIERLLDESARDTAVFWKEESLHGFVMLRLGTRATQIGPAIALSNDGGSALCNWASRRCRGQAVFIDVPLENASALAWARGHGLTEQRRFTRMSRGQPIPEQAANLWASSGPEKG
jgi:GNAT superfamily N-acetyltransferase